MPFCSAGEKMRNASGVKMSDNENKSEQEHVRHFLHKTCNQEVSGSFTFQWCKTTAKKCTKKVCCTCKVAFLLIRPIVFLLLLFFFLHLSRCLRHLAFHDFMLCLSKTININESFAFSPGQIYILFGVFLCDAQKIFMDVLYLVL